MAVFLLSSCISSLPSSLFSLSLRLQLLPSFLSFPLFAFLLLSLSAPPQLVQSSPSALLLLPPPCSITTSSNSPPRSLSLLPSFHSFFSSPRCLQEASRSEPSPHSSLSVLSLQPLFFFSLLLISYSFWRLTAERSTLPWNHFSYVPICEVLPDVFSLSSANLHLPPSCAMPSPWTETGVKSEIEKEKYDIKGRGTGEGGGGCYQGQQTESSVSWSRLRSADHRLLSAFALGGIMSGITFSTASATQVDSPPTPPLPFHPLVHICSSGCMDYNPPLLLLLRLARH